MFKIARGVLATLLIAGTANIAMAQGASKLHTVKNSVKYKNTGAKPATGRSGSATLEARVLIAKDNSMLLEASTSSIGAATHPGTITKMQVKVGEFTKNYNGLNAGGFWSATLPAATPLTNIQLQGNIKGIDPKRNDVVTVTTPAVRRPDVAVTAVIGAQQEKPNTPVTFFGTVRELNGHIGATVVCVLTINGNAVATTPDIWVDAAGTVSCQFEHTFPAAGTYTVGVRATDVNPGDWDTANNSAATTITIVNPDKKISNGYMGVHQNTYEYRYEWSRSGGNYCNYDYWYYCEQSYKDIRTEHFSNVYMWGYNYNGKADLLQTLNAKISTNGSVTDQISMQPLYTYNDGWQNCAQYYGNAYWDGTKYVYPGVYFNMCSYGDATYGSSHFNFQRIEGDAVYLNRRKECYPDGSCYESEYYYYYWNNYRYGSGGDFNWTAGDNVRVELEYVSVDGRKHTLDKTVTLEGGSNGWQDGPYSYWNEWEGQVNYLQRHFQKWANGWISWNNE